MQIRYTTIEGNMCFQIDPQKHASKNIFLPMIHVTERNSQFKVQTLFCGDLNPYQACDFGMALIAAGSLNALGQMDRLNNLITHMQQQPVVDVGGIKMHVVNH